MATFYAKYPGNSATISGTVTVTQGTSPWIVASTHARANAPITLDYTSGGGVTTGAYVQLVASTAAAISRISLQDISGGFLIFAVGAAASEVDQFYWGPGAAQSVDLNIASGSRLSIKALVSNVTTGRLIMSFFT